MRNLVTFIACAGKVPVTLPAHGICAVQCTGDGECIVTDSNGYDWYCAEPHLTVCKRWSEALRSIE